MSDKNQTADRPEERAVAAMPRPVLAVLSVRLAGSLRTGRCGGGLQSSNLPPHRLHQGADFPVEISHSDFGLEEASLTIKKNKHTQLAQIIAAYVCIAMKT